MRLLHDVRDAERPADLDELAAAHDRLVARCELREHHHDGGGVVVDGDGSFCPGQGAEQLLAVGMAAAARHVVDVVLERRVAPDDLVDRLDGLLGEHRAPEVGVHDDPGRVDYPTQARHEVCLEASRRHTRDRRRIHLHVPAREHICPRLADRTARCIEHELVREPFRVACQLGIVQHVVDFGQRSQQRVLLICLHHSLGLSCPHLNTRSIYWAG